MKSRWTVVCLIAALLAGLGASAAVASPLLTVEEMSTVKGGCVTLRCNWLDCAAGYPPECNGTVLGSCIPGNPTYACDVTKVAPISVLRCVSGTSGTLCSLGDRKGCGWKSACVCEIVTVTIKGVQVQIRVCVPHPIGWNTHYYECSPP